MTLAAGIRWMQCAPGMLPVTSAPAIRCFWSPVREYGGKKLIAAVGVENLVIVEGRDSILVCPVDQAQRVKEVVETLEKEGRTERL